MKNEIEAFLAIVRFGNISKAANHLFMSQSTISQRLNSLEKELNVTLIKRRKGVESTTLTNAGQRFWSIAVKWENLMKEAHNINNYHSGETLTIGAVDSIHSFVFNEFYNDLVESFNNTKIFLRTHQSDELYWLLDRREIDIGFALQERVSKNFFIEKVFDEELVLVTRGERKYNDTIVLSDLDPLYELYINWGLAFQQWHEKWLGTENTFGTQVDTGNILSSLFTKNENYWAIIPVSLAKNFKKNVEINIFRIIEEAPVRSCFLIYNNPEYQELINNWLTKNKSTLFDIVQIDSLLSKPINTLLYN